VTERSRFGTTGRISSRRSSEVAMLRLAILFLVVGIVAALLGFTGIAGASFAIAKIFAFIFLVLFLVFLLIGMSVAKRI
jgi:uncharacterized membrane protein YtjA (UPF0391 family)